MAKGGNKGEWSELYVMLSLLSEGKLFAANENLEKIEGLFYNIVKVLRQEDGGLYEYNRKDNIHLVVKSKVGQEEIDFSIEEFSQYAERLKRNIPKIGKDNELRSLLPEVDAFMQRIRFKTLKASSSEKKDITIVIHDPIIGCDVQQGFSIKSDLGSSPTLLNASRATNFIFEIKFSPKKGSSEIFDLSAQKLAKKIVAEKFVVEFVRLQSAVLYNNLCLIDSQMPIILQNLVWSYYSTDNSRVKDLVEMLKKDNPLNVASDLIDNFYPLKVKHFLAAVALGMMPATAWDGIEQANGGYIVVKENGDLVCYHLYNRNDFHNYLYHNTKLDTPSVSRHKHGKLFKENGSFLLRLNLQIRFI